MKVSNLKQRVPGEMLLLGDPLGKFGVCFPENKLIKDYLLGHNGTFYRVRYQNMH